jgi:hypothetical protein
MAEGVRFIRVRGRVVPVREKAKNLAKVAVGATLLGGAAHVAQKKLESRGVSMLVMNDIERAGHKKFIKAMKDAYLNHTLPPPPLRSTYTQKLAKSSRLIKLSRYAGGLKIAALSVASAAASGAIVGFAMSKKGNK